MTPTDQTIYTLSIPEMAAFRSFADSEPMCKDWSVASELYGWTVILVPNWTDGIKDFYRKIFATTEYGEVQDEKPDWFEGINPVIAETRCK